MREKNSFQQQRKTPPTRWPNLILVCLVSTLIPWGLFLTFHPRFRFRSGSVGEFLSSSNSKNDSSGVVVSENMGFAVQVSSEPVSAAKTKSKPAASVITGQGSTKFTVYGDTAVIGSSNVIPPAYANLDEDSPVLGPKPTKGNLFCSITSKHSFSAIYSLRIVSKSTRNHSFPALALWS